jgi:hypothetical protein
MQGEKLAGKTVDAFAIRKNHSSSASTGIQSITEPPLDG